MVLNFLAKKRLGSAHRRASHDRKMITIETLRGSDAPGDKATIYHVLVRYKPICIRHNCRSTWVEEFFFQWETEQCTLGEALD